MLGWNYLNEHVDWSRVFFIGYSNQTFPFKVVVRGREPPPFYQEVVVGWRLSDGTIDSQYKKKDMGGLTLHPMKDKEAQVREKSPSSFCPHLLWGLVKHGSQVSSLPNLFVFLVMKYINPRCHIMSNTWKIMLSLVNLWAYGWNKENWSNISTTSGNPKFKPTSI